MAEMIELLFKNFYANIFVAVGLSCKHMIQCAPKLGLMNFC